MTEVFDESGAWDREFQAGKQRFEAQYASNPTLTLLKRQGTVKPTLYVFASGGLSAKEALRKLQFEVIPFDAEGDRSYSILWNPRTNIFSPGPRALSDINMTAIQAAILEGRLSKADFKDLIWSDPAQALWEFISSSPTSKSLLRDKHGLYKIGSSGGRVLFRTQALARAWVEERCSDFEEDAFRVCQSWQP
jgi:hypothetical protein